MSEAHIDDSLVAPGSGRRTSARETWFPRSVYLQDLANNPGTTMKPKLPVLALAAVSTLSTASAQGLVNGGFEAGLSGWSLAPFGSPGAGSLQVAAFDIDGAGPLATSNAARVVTGLAPGGSGSAGRDLTQSVHLEAGVPYRLRVGWSAQNLGASGFSFNAIEFRAFIPGVTTVSESVGPIGGNTAQRGVLLREFTPSATGTYPLTVRVSRRFEATSDLVVWLDDIELGVRPVTVCSCSSFNGCLTQLDSDEIASASSRLPMMITGSLFPNNQNGLFFYGTELGSNPISTSFCVGGGLRRMLVQSTGGTPGPTIDCSGQPSVDFNAWIQSGIDPGLQPGTSVFMQFWFRDAFSPAGFSFSDTLTFVISS